MIVIMTIFPFEIKPSKKVSYIENLETINLHLLVD